MKKIYKYQLEDTDKQEIIMPKGAEILSCQVQREAITIWAVVDLNNKPEKRTFRIYGTGFDINYDHHHKFIGTVQQNHGMLVWHVFEYLP